jgi:hypothetical protein
MVYRVAQDVKVRVLYEGRVFWVKMGEGIGRVYEGEKLVTQISPFVEQSAPSWLVAEAVSDHMKRLAAYEAARSVG